MKDSKLSEQHREACLVAVWWPLSIPGQFSKSLNYGLLKIWLLLGAAAVLEDICPEWHWGFLDWLIRTGWREWFSNTYTYKDAESNVLCISPLLSFVWGLPCSSVGKETSCNAGVHLQSRRPWLDSWVGKIPWRKKWQPSPVFLPGNPTDREPGSRLSTGSQDMT